MINSSRSERRGVDDVREDLRGLGDDGELSGSATPARSFDSYSSSSRGVEPFEVRLVPEDVGLLGHFDRAGNTMPHRQRIADVLEDRGAAAAYAPALGEARARTARSCRTPPRPRARAVPARRSSPAPRRPGSAAPATGSADRSGRRAGSRSSFSEASSMIAISSSRRVNGAGHARLQAAQEFILLQRVEPNQHHDTVAEQDRRHHLSLTRNASGVVANYVAALQARCVDAVRDEKARAVVRVPPNGDLEAWVMEVSGLRKNCILSIHSLSRSTSVATLTGRPAARMAVPAAVLTQCAGSLWCLHG